MRRNFALIAQTVAAAAPFRKGSVPTRPFQTFIDWPEGQPKRNGIFTVEDLDDYLRRNSGNGR